MAFWSTSEAEGVVELFLTRTNPSGMNRFGVKAWLRSSWNASRLVLEGRFAGGAHSSTLPLGLFFRSGDGGCNSLALVMLDTKVMGSVSDEETHVDMGVGSGESDFPRTTAPSHQPIEPRIHKDVVSAHPFIISEITLHLRLSTPILALNTKPGIHKR